MTTTGVLGAIIFGAIIGAIGRLLAPGKPGMPIWLTIGVGVGAAFAGTGLTRLLNLKARGFNFWEPIFQIGIAALAVFLVAVLWPRGDDDALT
jgi:uncharacterized membrane protein YeaQ/YmgE (transglycosylase-associated protein family)